MLLLLLYYSLAPLKNGGGAIKYDNELENNSNGAIENDNRPGSNDNGTIENINGQPHLGRLCHT